MQCWCGNVQKIMLNNHRTVIRVFGCELFRLLIIVIFLSMMIFAIILPMPQYYIKHQDYMGAYDYEPGSRPSLNRILEEEAQKSGIRYDKGSFEILDSHGMSFNHLFLCSYRINGTQEVRIFHFEKNIFGNMKPKYPLSQSYIIPKSADEDDFYRAYVEDGIFGGYLLTAGYASETTVLKNYKLNHFRVDQVHPSNYFMWIELVHEPWKTELVKFILTFLFILVLGTFLNRYRKPVKFYSGWRKGDKIFQRRIEE